MVNKKGFIDFSAQTRCLESDPILATEAVRVMNDNVNQDEAVLLLGHPLKITAERKFSKSSGRHIELIVAAYLKQEEVKYQSSSSEWLIASVILAVFMVLLVLWLLFLMYKQYWVSHTATPHHCINWLDCRGERRSTTFSSRPRAHPSTPRPPPPARRCVMTSAWTGAWPGRPTSTSQWRETGLTSVTTSPAGATVEGRLPVWPTTAATTRRRV